MEIIKKYGLIFASAILLATAVFISVNKSDGITARAEGTNYTAKWEASELLALTVDKYVPANQNEVPLDIPLGVSKWKVTGWDSTGQVLFEEAWAAPGIGSEANSVGVRLKIGPNYIDVNGNPFNSVPLECGVSGERFGAYGNFVNKYLISASSVTPMCATVSSKTVSQIRTKIGTTTNLSNIKAGLTSCFKPGDATGNKCFQTNGAYGFAVNDTLGANDSGANTMGTIMPLEWTVTGKIY